MSSGHFWVTSLARAESNLFPPCTIKTPLRNTVLCPNYISPNVPGNVSCLRSAPTPPTSKFGWQASEIPGLSVELFTMPQIHHRGAIGAHCVPPLTVSMVDPDKGPAWRGSLVRGPLLIINLVQSRAETPLSSTNDALIAGTTSWVGRRVSMNVGECGWMWWGGLGLTRTQDV